MQSMMMIIDNNQNADDTLHFSVRLIIWTFSESSSVSRNILGKSIGQKEVKMRHKNMAKIFELFLRQIL